MPEPSLSTILTLLRPLVYLGVAMSHDPNVCFTIQLSPTTF
jgi:hypothetical protein